MTETVGVDFTCAAQIATNPIKIDDEISPIWLSQKSMQNLISVNTVSLSSNTSWTHE